MKVLIAGATGYIGAGVLAEALATDEVERVVVVGRSSCGTVHPKLREVLIADFARVEEVADQLGEVDACFWCVGVSSAGMSEADYTRITYEYTMATVKLLEAQTGTSTFCFVSGEGADGRAMWAKVKKRAEDGVRTSALRSVSMRPGLVRDDHNATLRGFWMRAGYVVGRPFEPLARRIGMGTSNSEIGQAMIVAAREKLDGLVLNSAAINELAARF